MHGNIILPCKIDYKTATVKKGGLLSNSNQAEGSPLL